MLSDLDDDDLEEIESRLYSQIHYGASTNDQPDENCNPIQTNPIYFPRRRYYERTKTRETTHTINIVDPNIPVTTTVNEQNIPPPTPNPQESINISNQQQSVLVVPPSSPFHKFINEKCTRKRNVAKKELKAKTERIVKAANEDAELFRNLSCEERKSVFKYQKRQRYLERKRLRKLEKEQSLVDQYNNDQIHNYSPQIANLPPADIQPPPTLSKERVETITKQNDDEVVSLSGSEGSSCIAVDLPVELLVISDNEDLSEPPKISAPVPKIEENTDEVKIEHVILSNDDDDDDDVIYIEQQPAAVIDLDPEPVIKETHPPTDSELMKPPDSETLSVCSASSNNLSAELKVNNLKTTPKKAKVTAKEREEQLSTPESNDFLDSTLDVEQDNFNFSLHGTDFNASKDAPKSKTLADMCGSESSCSASDISAPVKTSIFTEIDFDAPSKGLFSENNLKSFSDFITPKRTSTSMQITQLLTPSRNIFERVPTKAVGARCDSDSDSSSENEYGDNKIAQISKKLPDLSHFEINKTPKSDKKGKNEGESTKKKKKKHVDLVEEVVPSLKEKKRKKSKGLDFGNNSSEEKDEAKPKKKKGKKGSSLEGSDNELTPKRVPRKEEETESSDKKSKRKKIKEDDVSQSATKKKRKKRMYDEWIENANDCDEPSNVGCIEVDEDVLNTSGESCSHKPVNTTEKVKKINIISEQVLKFQFDFNKSKSKKIKKSNDETEDADAEVTSEISRGKKLKKSRKSSELQEDSPNRGGNDEEADGIIEETEVEIAGKGRGKKVKKSRKSSELQGESPDRCKDAVAEEVAESNEISNKPIKRTRKASENKKNSTEEDDETPESNETNVQTVKRRRKSSENIKSTTESTENDPQEGKRKRKSSENQNVMSVEDQTVLQIETAYHELESNSEIESTIPKPTGELSLDSNLQNTGQNSSGTPFIEPNIELPVQNIVNESTDQPEQKYSDISDPEDDANTIKDVEVEEKKPEPFVAVIDLDNSDSEVEIIDNKNDLDVIEVGDSDSESVPCEDPSCANNCDSSSSSSSDNQLIDVGTAGNDIEVLNVESNTPNEDLSRPKRFSDHFARDMNEFYTHSYGAEKLSLHDIQRDMTDNPSKWKILERDRVHVRFSNERGPRCRRCREIGHKAAYCKNKVGPPKCCLCGNRGHYEPRCRNKICTQCGCKCFDTTVFCSNCAYLRNRTCKLCKMTGHEKDNCPDIWRRYHLTVTEGPTFKSTEPPLKPYMKQWCSGCAQNGHLEHECNYYGREHPPAAPYIVDYEELYGFPQENISEVDVDANRSSDIRDIQVSFDNDRFQNPSPIVVHNPKVTIDMRNYTRMVEDEVMQVEDEAIISECILFTSIQADILKNTSGQMFLCGLADRFQLPLQLSKHYAMPLNCIHVTASKSLGLKVKELIMEFLHGKSRIANKKLYFKLKHHLELLASIPLERPSYLFDLIWKSQNVGFDKYVRLNTLLFGKYGVNGGKQQTQLLLDIFMGFDTARAIDSKAAKVINNALAFVFLTVRPLRIYRKLVKIAERMDFETSSNAPMNKNEKAVETSENKDLETSTSAMTNYTFHNSFESTPEYMSLLTEPNTHMQIVCVRPYSTTKFIKNSICGSFLQTLKRKMKVEILKQNLVLHGSKDDVEEGAWRLKIFVNNLHLVDDFPNKAAAIYEKLVKAIAKVNVWWYIENVRQLYDEIRSQEEQNDKNFSPAACKLLGKLYTKLNAILFGKYCDAKGHRTMTEMINWTRRLINKKVNGKRVQKGISEAYFYIFDFNKKDIDYEVFIDDLVMAPVNLKTGSQSIQSQRNYITRNLEKYMLIAAEKEDDIRIQELELLMSMMKEMKNLDGIVRYVQDLNAS